MAFTRFDMVYILIGLLNNEIHINRCKKSEFKNRKTAGFYLLERFALQDFGWAIAFTRTRA